MGFTRPYLEKQVDALDASVFSGDAFLDKQNRDALREMMARWERKLQSIDQMPPDDEEEDEEG